MGPTPKNGFRVLGGGPPAVTWSDNSRTALNCSMSDIVAPDRINTGRLVEFLPAIDA